MNRAEARGGEMSRRLQALGGFLGPRMRLVRASRADCDEAPRDSAIHRIALLPVEAPVRLRTEDRTLTEPFMPPPEHLSADDRQRRSLASEKMGCIRDSLGVKLTAALRGDLETAGFKTSLIDSVKRLPNCLEAVDYKALPTCEAVLHVAFTEVGMATSAWSSDYGPRVNARACLLAHPDATDWLASDHFFYGADASGDTFFSVPADPQHCYVDSNALIDRVDEMPQVYDLAVQAIAKRVAQHLCARFGARPLQSRNFA